MITVWLLTKSDPDDTSGIKNPFEFEVTYLGLEDLHNRYGAQTPGGVPTFVSIWDLWRYSVFIACLHLAQERGELPDLVEHGSTWSMALAPLLYDITEVIQDEDVIAPFTFLSRALRSCCPEEGQPNAHRYYALPFTVDCRVFFYKFPFKESHFRFWPSFEKQLADPRILTSFKSQNARFAVQMQADALHDALSWIWAAGGDVLSAEGLQVRIDSPETVEGMMRLVKLVRLGLAPAWNEAPISLHEARIQMSQGLLQASMAIAWRRNPMPHVSNFPLDDFQTSLPPGDMHRTSFVGGTNLGVVKKYLDNRKGEYNQAIDLLKYLVLDEYVLETYDLLHPDLTSIPAWVYNWRVGKLPPQIKVLQYWQHEDDKRHLDTFMQALWGPDDLRLPSIAQMAWIEEQLKDRFRDLWQELDPLISQEDWETRCRTTIQKRFREAKVQIQQELYGILQMRARRAQLVPGGRAETFLEKGLYGRPEVTNRLHLQQFDLIVDEESEQCRVWDAANHRYQDVPFSSLGEPATELLLAMVRSDTGSIDLPFHKRSDLEGLFALVETWHTVKRNVDIEERKQFLLHLAEVAMGRGPTHTAEAIRKKAETWLTHPIATASTGHLIECINRNCLQVLEDYVVEATTVPAIRSNRHTINNLRNTLRTHLGERVIPLLRPRAAGAVALADDISICHIRPL